MRVGLVSPPWYAVPPKGYGGIELVVSLLAEGLADRGIDITLFATGDSHTSAELEYVYETAPSERIGESIWELDHVLLALEQADELDLIHDHSGPLGLALLGSAATVLHTVHGPLDERMGELYGRICGALDNVWLTSLSLAQRGTYGELPWLANVPNAIDVERFCLGTGERDDYLLFLGRMCQEKGAHRAIEVAHAAGRRLVIAAKCREEPELEYFQKYVEPHLGDGIEYVGEASLDEKVELLQRAAVTLVPIEWEEPFGLVMIESAACGTPVVATRRGSVSEVVVEGVTGIVVDDHLDMPAVLDRASALDPVAMREAIVSRFDAERMVSGYVLAYEDALRRTASRNGSGPRRSRTKVARLRKALSYTHPASTKTPTRRRT